jgi:hypothetical protein
MLKLWNVMLVWAAAIPTIVAQGTFTGTIRATDSQGRPVANAEAAPFWSIKNGVMTARADGKAITDEEGKAVLRLDDWGHERAVLVLSEDRALGGLMRVSRLDDGKELSLELGPTVSLKGKVECSELNAVPSWTSTVISAQDSNAPQFAEDVSASAQFQFLVPAGDYLLRISGENVESLRKTVTLAAEQQEHDLGTLDLKATAIAKLRGKPAPQWDVTAARGIGLDTSLADYRGKWVLLEFWGFW